MQRILEKLYFEMSEAKLLHLEFAEACNLKEASRFLGIAEGLEIAIRITRLDGKDEDSHL